MYLAECCGGTVVLPNVLPGPGTLGLQVRNVITLSTRKSDVETQVLGEITAHILFP